MGFLDDLGLLARHVPDDAKNALKGLLGGMPLTQMARGEFQMPDMPTKNGLAEALRGMPKPFDNSPEANVAAMEQAMNYVNPMGLLGKIVYHGSPHKFDKFDASKIGTGEGAQAYGHGTYLADAEGVAKEYANANAGRGAVHDGFVDNLPVGVQVEVMRLLNQKSRGSLAKEQFANIRDRVAPEQYQQIMDRFDNGGALYKADLPDEWIPKMLDWDKPVPKESIEAMAKQSIDAIPANRAWARGMLETWKQYPPREGREIVENLSKYLGKENTAAFLKAADVPGIRYLDGGSRGAGQGSYNYVIFPGMEDKVKILERNGVPLDELLGLLGQ